jgi:Zn finger protein HypA/HybF involved in hydrogenase expression
MDPFGIPWKVVVVLLLIPVAVSTFFGASSFRRIAPLAFRCQRCRSQFRQAPHRVYPDSCPRCGARDWSSTSPAAYPKR